VNDHIHIDGDVAELRKSVAGQIVTGDDAGYDAARRCFNALVDRRPAVIVRCSSAADVATAFDFARAHELEVAVRGAGHNPAGFASSTTVWSSTSPCYTNKGRATHKPDARGGR
jgi:FAD/FMN-containing dehydrogenase